MDELRNKAEYAKDQRLESVFLSLTGGEEMREIIDILKR
jgi:hypothetical protein